MDAQDASVTPVAQEPKTCRIGDVTYRLEPASLEQHEWLKAGPLAGVDFGAGLSERDLLPIVQARGSEILGMVLIAEGMTREEKCDKGLAEALSLGKRFKKLLTPSEVRALAFDFFTIDGFQNLAFFVDFHALRAAAPSMSTAVDLTPLSASSPTETAPSALLSSDSVGPETVSSNCSEPLNTDCASARS